MFPKNTTYEGRFLANETEPMYMKLGTRHIVAVLIGGEKMAAVRVARCPLFSEACTSACLSRVHRSAGPECRPINCLDELRC